MSVHVSGTVTCVTHCHTNMDAANGFFFGGARSQSGANADAQTTKTDESKGRLYNIVRAYIFSIFNVHLGDLESMYIYILSVCVVPHIHT